MTKFRQIKSLRFWHFKLDIFSTLLPFKDWNVTCSDLRMRSVGRSVELAKQKDGQTVNYLYWVLVVAQLVKRLLPTLRSAVRESSHQKNLYWTFNLKMRKLKKKRPGMAHLKIIHLPTYLLRNRQCATHKSNCDELIARYHMQIL